MYFRLNTGKRTVLVNLQGGKPQVCGLHIDVPAVEQPYIFVDAGAAVPAAAPGAAFYGNQHFVLLTVTQIISRLHRKIRIAVGTAAHLRLIHEHAGVPVDPLELQKHMPAPVLLRHEKFLVIFIFPGVNTSRITAVHGSLLLFLMEHGVIWQINAHRIFRHMKYQFKGIQILPDLPVFVKADSFHTHTSLSSSVLTSVHRTMFSPLLHLF